MNKCREAFEKQKHLTIYISNLVFDEKDNRYIPNEKRIRTFEEWEWKAFSNQAYAVNLAWWAWQSRQAEINQLQSQINEMAEVGLSQESVIRGKDKRIEELESALKKINENLDLHDCESCWQHYFEIEKVLPEMQGANNANS